MYNWGVFVKVYRKWPFHRPSSIVIPITVVTEQIIHFKIVYSKRIISSLKRCDSCKWHASYNTPKLISCHQWSQPVHVLIKPAETPISNSQNRYTVYIMINLTWARPLFMLSLYVIVRLRYTCKHRQCWRETILSMQRLKSHTGFHQHKTWLYM